MTVRFHALWQSLAYETEKVASDTNAAETFQLRFFQVVISQGTGIGSDGASLYNEFERYRVCLEADSHTAILGLLATEK